MASYLDSDQQQNINKGRIQQTILRNQISEALTNNPHKDNYIISSDPGMGKSHETDALLATLPNSDDVLRFDGSSGIFSLMIDFTTARYLTPGHMICVFDDCDVLFEKDNLNLTKKMFDQTKKMVYGKNWRKLKSQLTDIQMEAIEHFSSEERVGFEVPTDDATFLILTNRYIPTSNDLKALEEGSQRYNVAKGLFAIRRRTQCNPITMPLDTLWGYVANIVLNEKICEKFKPTITKKEKHQIVEWMDKHWDNVTERNLSLAEKMTKEMVRYPKDYLDIWKHNYLDV